MVRCGGRRISSSIILGGVSRTSLICYLGFTDPASPSNNCAREDMTRTNRTRRIAQCMVADELVQEDAVLLVACP